jgi:hypothetical protein
VCLVYSGWDWQHYSSQLLELHHSAYLQTQPCAAAKYVWEDANWRGPKHVLLNICIKQVFMIRTETENNSRGRTNLICTAGRKYKIMEFRDSKS